MNLMAKRNRDCNSPACPAYEVGWYPPPGEPERGPWYLYQEVRPYFHTHALPSCPRSKIRPNSPVWDPASPRSVYAEPAEGCQEPST